MASYFSIGFAALLLACGAPNGHVSPDASAADGSDVAPPVVTHINAATGGTVQDPSGDFVLEIPPNALSQDTDITLAIVPAYADAITAVAKFGPDGLTFSEPATLSVRVASALVPTGKVPAVALDTGGAFGQVERSNSSNLSTTGKISAPLSHFSSYAVVLADWDQIRCGNSLAVTVQAEQDPTVTSISYDGNGNIYVPGLYEDVLNTSCMPPVVQHLAGYGTAMIPYCLGACSTATGPTGQSIVVSSDGATAQITYSSNSCGAFSSPPEQYNILGGFLVSMIPNNVCQ